MSEFQKFGYHQLNAIHYNAIDLKVHPKWLTSCSSSNCMGYIYHLWCISISTQST